MSDSNIKTRQQAFRDEMEGAANLLVRPGGSAKLQQIILEAEQREATTIDDLARLISLANTSLFVAGSGLDDLFGSWYSEKAMQLLSRSMDALAVMEADRQPRPATGLN